MKYIFFLLMFININIHAQSFPELVQKYQDHCDSIVNVKIIQTGILIHELYPVQDTTGKLSHYTSVVVDTIWRVPDCPEYQFLDESTLFLYNYANDKLDIMHPNIILNDGLNETYIQREFFCECKHRQIVPFSNHFWEWILKQ